MQFLLLRSIGQARKSSNLELNSMRVYLAFESVHPCLRGSSSNNAHFLNNFFLGMMSLKDRHSLIHLGAERLNPACAAAPSCRSPAASQLSSQPGSSASSGWVGTDVHPASASVPGAGGGGCCGQHGSGQRLLPLNVDHWQGCLQGLDGRVRTADAGGIFVRCNSPRSSGSNSGMRR